MEYLTDIEETEYEPQFGYGYSPDKPKRKKKGKKDAEEEHFKGMKKPLANPAVPLLVSVVFALILLACVLLSVFSSNPGASARAPFSGASGHTVCADCFMESYV